MWVHVGPRLGDLELLLRGPAQVGRDARDDVEVAGPRVGVGRRCVRVDAVPVRGTLRSGRDDWPGAGSARPGDQVTVGWSRRDALLVAALGNAIPEALVGIHLTMPAHAVP